jgi:hypothetical protein
MAHFAEIFDALLPVCAPKVIAEVGSEYAGSTRMLASYAQANGAALYVVDPAPKTDLVQALSDFAGTYRHIRQKSIDALPGITADLVVLDGDHNYWTVINELRAVYANNSAAWVILHDVGEPCARRDLYYAPEQIPPEHRHRYSYAFGVDLETGEMVKGSGFGGAGDFAFALESNTARNGVLTAVEDFMSDHPELHYGSIPLIFGLGVIAPLEHRAFVDEVLKPYRGPLCSIMERNRLALYNQVLSQHHRARKTRIRRWANRLMDIAGL